MRGCHAAVLQGLYRRQIDTALVRPIIKNGTFGSLLELSLTDATNYWLELFIKYTWEFG